jgi:hypothetical protein
MQDSNGRLRWRPWFKKRPDFDFSAVSSIGLQYAAGRIQPSSPPNACGPWNLEPLVLARRSSKAIKAIAWPNHAQVQAGRP